MNKLERRRLEIGIGYFVKKFYEKIKKFPTQTQVYKFLAFVDFISAKERGKPVFGLKYLAMKNGPVPVDLYNEVKPVKAVKVYPYFKVIAHDNKREFAPIDGKELNMKLFSKEERELLDRFVEIFVEETLNTFHYSEASHEKIKAWKKAYNRKENSPMDYLDEIEDEKLRDIYEGFLDIQMLKRG